MELNKADMKRILTFISILPFLSACLQDPMEDMTQDNTPEFIDGESLVFDACIVSPDDQSVQNSNVRTVLGEKEGTSYPNYWAVDDAIFVNGATSQPLAQSSEYVGTSKAVFEVKSKVEAPYYFAYPASAVSNYSNGRATVTLPLKQQWSSTTYDASAFIMMGVSDQERLEFNPMMSAVRIKVNASGRKIRSITFMALGSEKVSGTFTTDFNGLTATADANSYVHIVAPSGGAASGSEVYLLIPSQPYESGMAFAIRATDGTQMIYSTKSSFTAKPSKIYPLTVSYSPEDTDINLMSSNVRFASARDKDDNPDTGDRDWTNRKSAYYTMLNTMQPDIVGLQEAEQEQVLDIKNNCPGYSHVGYGRESGKDITSELSALEQLMGKKHSESTTILYKTDKFTKHSYGWFCHSETPNKADTYFPISTDKQPRISTWVILTHKETGRKFFYLNTHTTIDNSRELEIGLIREQVGKLNTEKLPVILSGDWNLVEDDSWMLPITETYQSARRTAPITDNSYTYHWWESTDDKKQIDHIYYLGLECFEFHTVNQKWDNLYISDHYPIYARFGLAEIFVPAPVTDVDFTGNLSDDHIAEDMYNQIENDGSHEDYKPVDIY